MYYDKTGRLLVAASVERTAANKEHFLVDVFKDGVFLNRAKLDICNGHDYLKIFDEKIFFKGDRIFHINEPESLVTVFEY